ncbi:MAG: FeoA family protein [Vampirovibrionales bacterium]
MFTGLFKRKTASLPNASTLTLADGFTRQALCLAHLPANTVVRLVHVSDAETNLLLFRLGISVGDTLQILTASQLESPLVLRKHALECAVGYSYALHLWVEVV